MDKTTGLRSDQTIVLAGPKSSRLYPDPLRRVAFYDAEHKRRLVFLTNNFTLPALTIARLYKCRWQIEVTFRNTHILSSNDLAVRQQLLQLGNLFVADICFTSRSSPRAV